jgi:hypothetical protein
LATHNALQSGELPGDPDFENGIVNVIVVPAPANEFDPDDVSPRNIDGTFTPGSHLVPVANDVERVEIIASVHVSSHHRTNIEDRSFDKLNVTIDIAGWCRRLMNLGEPANLSREWRRHGGKNLPGSRQMQCVCFSFHPFVELSALLPRYGRVLGQPFLHFGVERLHNQTIAENRP